MQHGGKPHDSVLEQLVLAVAAMRAYNGNQGLMVPALCNRVKRMTITTTRVACLMDNDEFNEPASPRAQQWLVEHSICVLPGRTKLEADALRKAGAHRRERHKADL